MNEVVPSNRKFLCQPRNGDDFLTLPATDFVPYMQGAVLEKLKLIVDYDVSTITFASPTVKISATDEGAQIRIRHPFNDWLNEGLVVGNTIRIEANSNFVNETVNAIVGQDMYITDTAGNFISTLGVTSGDLRDDYVIKVTTVPTSLIFKFGLLENLSESDNFNSILDGQEQIYSANGLNSGGFVILNYLSSASSNLGTVKAKFISSSGTGNYIHKFTIEHIFRVPHFIATWLTNYLDETIPLRFAGANSYRYVSELNFGVNVNNPNDGKIFKDGFQSGSIGFMNQNFNVGSTVYQREIITTYSVASSEVSGPEISLSTVVEAQIKKTDGNFTAGVKGYLYHAKFTSENDYSDNSNTYEENFVFEQLFNVDGAGPKSNIGGIISNYTCTINGGDNSLLDIAFTLTYPAAQQDKFIANDRILLAMIVEEAVLSATLSDRTPIPLSIVQVTKNGDVSGQITNFQTNILQRGATTPKSNSNDWINQIYKMDFTFDIKKDVDSIDSSLNGLKLQIVTYNTALNDFVILNEFTFPLSTITSLVVDGTTYQVINLAAKRFLSVPESDQARDVQLTMAAPGAYAATQTVTGRIGYIIPWQEWIENLSIPDIFYDGSLPAEFFNKNQRTSNYSNLNGYDIFIFLIADMISGGLNTDYALFSDKCTVSDLGIDATGSGWTSVVEIFDEDGELTGTIFNQICEVRATFSQAAAGTLTLGDLMGQIVMEETGNVGRHFRLHTSLFWEEEINPLQPLSGETNLKKTQDVPGNKIILRCSVDGNKLDPEKTYRFYPFLNDST